LALKNSLKTSNETTIFPGGGDKELPFWTLQAVLRLYEVVREASADEFKTNNDLHYSAFFAICIRISALKNGLKTTSTSL
jgi:hypothetical protein